MSKLHTPLGKLIIALATVWVVFGSTYFAITLTISTMPGLISTGLRFTVAAAVIVTIMLVTGRASALRVSRRQFTTAFIGGAVVMGISIGAIVLAEEYVPSGLVAVTESLMPVWIVLFRTRAQDRVSRLTMLGVALGLSGVFMTVLGGGFSAPADEQLLVGIWLAIIVATTVLWGYFAWKAPQLNMPKNSLVSTIYQMLGAAVVLPLGGLAVGEKVDVSIISAQAWMGWFYLIVASAAGYVAYTWLFSNASASLASSYSYASPVIAIALGAFFGGELFTFPMLIGMTVAVVGVVLITRAERPSFAGEVQREDLGGLDQLKESVASRR